MKTEKIRFITTFPTSPFDEQLVYVRVSHSIYDSESNRWFDDIGYEMRLDLSCDIEVLIKIAQDDLLRKIRKTLSSAGRNES